MDFSMMATDDLFTTMPQGEDDRWEVKSATLLDPSKKNDLKKELGKQVSAFANSGGGNLVLGISNAGTLEPCPETVGRQIMKDYLSTMVEQSVEYPIRHFRVHRVPFTGDPTKSVFVVAIEDSPAAPHQSKEDRTYYYRIDGHSKPAPHFHVELLRSRYTNAVLKIVAVENSLQIPSTQGSPWQLSFNMRVTVENVSLQCATNWGVLVEHKDGERDWSIPKVGANLGDGGCVQGERATILPRERVPLIIHLVGSTHTQTFSGLLDLHDHMRLVLRPVSQNHVGEEWVFGVPKDEMAARIARQNFSTELEKYGIRK